MNTVFKGKIAVIGDFFMRTTYIFQSTKVACDYVIVNKRKKMFHQFK